MMQCFVHVYLKVYLQPHVERGFFSQLHLPESRKNREWINKQNNTFTGVSSSGDRAKMRGGWGWEKKQKTSSDKEWHYFLHIQGVVLFSGACLYPWQQLPWQDVHMAMLCQLVRTMFELVHWDAEQTGRGRKGKRRGIGGRGGAREGEEGRKKLPHLNPLGRQPSPWSIMKRESEEMPLSVWLWLWGARLSEPPGKQTQQSGARS